MPKKPASPRSKNATSPKPKPLIQNTSTLVSRSALANQLGVGFNGKRDYYEIFGYPLEVTYDTLYNLYDRDGLSSRAGDGIAEESWRKPPIVKDGDAVLNASEPTPEDKQTDFLKKLAEFDKTHHIYSLLMECDKMLAYSRYAGIFIGAPGNANTELTGKPKIAYLEELDEGSMTVASNDTDKTSERYGMPTMYSITFADERTAVSAHWTRVIHFREGKEKGSRCYGKPRLRKALNYLLDLQKVVGGSSESFWLLIRKGLALVAREGVDMPQPGTAEYTALQDEIEEYEHQLRRTLRLRGVDIQDLGSEVPVAEGQFRLLLSALAGTLKTPQRIIIGSEAGQLASSQDDKNFSDVVSSRLTNFCYPMMATPFIQRMIDLGTLPEPSSGSFELEAPPLFELNPVEKITMAGGIASALSTMTNGAPEMAMPVETFTSKYIGYVMSDTEKQAKMDELLKRREEMTPPELTEPGGNPPAEEKAGENE